MKQAIPGLTCSSSPCADTLLEVILRSDLADPRLSNPSHTHTGTRGCEVIAGNSWSSVTSQETKEERSVRCQQAFVKHNHSPCQTDFCYLSEYQGCHLDDGGSKHLRNVGLHRATSQKRVIFCLAVESSVKTDTVCFDSIWVLSEDPTEDTF